MAVVQGKATAPTLRDWRNVYGVTTKCQVLHDPSLVGWKDGPLDEAPCLFFVFVVAVRFLHPLMAACTPLLLPPMLLILFD